LIFKQAKFYLPSFQKLVRTILQLHRIHHLSIWPLTSLLHWLLFLSDIRLCRIFTFQSRDGLYFKNWNRTRNHVFFTETCQYPP